LVAKVEEFHSQNRIPRGLGFVAPAIAVGIVGHDNAEPRRAHSRGHASGQGGETLADRSQVH